MWVARPKPGVKPAGGGPVVIRPATPQTFEVSEGRGQDTDRAIIHRLGREAPKDRPAFPAAAETPSPGFGMM
jgi:hypothetical protein